MLKWLTEISKSTKFGYKNPIVNAHGTLDETPEDGIFETQS